MLRPLVARDAGELFLLVDDHRRALRPWLPWVDATKAIADSSYYILSLTGLWKSGVTFGVFLDSTLCGTVGFQSGDVRHHRAEIGYWVAPPYQGRGLATQAVSLAIEGALEQSQLHRVEARVQESNKPSIALLQKLGFQFEGIERGGIRFGDQYKDHQMYSLLRPDFEASR